jgi:hypothetical protein
VAQSLVLRAREAREVTKKPKIEGQERKEHESPPVALEAEEDGDEQDPRSKKGAHHNYGWGGIQKDRSGPVVNPRAAGPLACTSGARPISVS